MTYQGASAAKTAANGSRTAMDTTGVDYVRVVMGIIAAQCAGWAKGTIARATTKRGTVLRAGPEGEL